MEARLDQLGSGCVVVTGGASGIGLAAAGALLRLGREVAILDLDPKKLEQARASFQDFEARLSLVQVDVSDEASIETALDKVGETFSRITALLNSAGIGNESPFLDTSAATLRKLLDVNVVGTFNMCRQTAGRMPKTGGAIVNVASISGIRGNAGRSAYGASKGAVIAMSKVMAVELAGKGIRVNVVAPGPVNTPMGDQMHSNAALRGWMKVIPQRRVAEVEEITGGILFLLDEKNSSYVTGQVLAIDGGFESAGLLPA
jgi:NAD(P)-dependent dehydrogenase (short-subunit alcohol dehydrogenase family)